MSYYKYQIKIDNGQYYFALYPNNNNKIPVIKSNGYNSYEDALKAKENFATLVSIRRETAFRIEKISVSRYCLTFTHENIIVRRIEKSRTICREVVMRIVKNIHAPLVILED